jgi:hypothetical protein
VAANRPFAARTGALVVLAGCVALIGVGAWLKPNPSGIGTHQQFGLPPCTMVLAVGYPCPTCGMTTAFAHAVRGRFLQSFHAHPAGFAFALAVFAAGAISINVIVTGRVWSVNWYRIPPVRVVVAVVLLIAGGWIYKLVVGVLSGALPIGR